MNAAKGLSSGLGVLVLLVFLPSWLCQLEFRCLRWFACLGGFWGFALGRRSLQDCSHPRVLDTSFTTHPIGLDPSHWVLLTCSSCALRYWMTASA